ncbi:MAG TPA: FHA domain-containing protein [Kofleriaceae bacterium]
MPIYLEYMGYSVEVPAGETIVGRDVTCALRFNDSSVSRRHLRLVRAADRVIAEDLGSTNGTTLNGRMMHGKTRLADGDAIELGGYCLELRVVDEAADELATRKVTSLSELGKIKRAPRPSSTTTQPTRIPISLTRAATTEPVPPQSSDRRRADRKAIEIPIVYTSADLEIEVTTRDLSLTGVFLRSDVLEPVGTQCELVILIDGGPPIRARGIVRRVVETEPEPEDADAEPVGLGIEFVELGDAERHWLERTIEQTSS